ncbi:hypothetical protein BGX29_002282, partial [Mortierella sp. GBA35]
MENDPAFSRDYTPRRSIKKLELRPRNSEGSFGGSQQYDTQRSSITFNSQLGERAAENSNKSRSSNGKAMEGLSPLASSQNQSGSAQHETVAASLNAASSNVDLSYWTRPSLKELRLKRPVGLMAVKEFQVGRTGFGNIKFLEPVDLTTPPSLASICGHIVQFSNKTCVVYPEDQEKPRLGEGLNVPAIISLQNCLPLDDNRKPTIAAKSTPLYDRHLRKLKSKPNTEFLNYTENGTWTFRVGHFSKYGLDDDEDDDEEDAAQEQGGRRALSRVAAAAAIAGTAAATAVAYHAYGTSHDYHVAHPHHADAMDKEQDESSGPEDSLRRSSLNLAHTDLMMGRSCRVGWGPNGMMAVCATVSGFEAIMERVDRSNGKEVLESQEISQTVVQLSKLKVVAASKETEIQRHGTLLEAQLQHTTITLDQNNESRAGIRKATSFTAMISLKEEKHKLSQEEVYVWILGQSLSDKQPFPDNVTEMLEAAPDSYEAIGRRRVRCVNWLSHIIKPAPKADLRRLEQSQGQVMKGDTIFTLLANNKGQKAVVAAVQAGESRLAILISPSGPGSRPLAGVEDQSALYTNAGVESSILADYLNAYAPLCGALTVNVAPKDAPCQLVTDRPDWKRTFGLHLWYSNTPGVNLAKAVNAYFPSMAENPVVAKAAPWYQKSKEEQPKHYDILFQLMALLMIPSKSLEDALHPLGISPAVLDYRLSWLFYMVLTQSLHFKICVDFMFQLESLGLWHWAVFVALHLETALARETTVRHVLERNVQLYTSPLAGMKESEVAAAERAQIELVKKSLCVPEEWIWSARATRAKYEGDQTQKVVSLLRGGEVQRGHSLIVSTLAP